MKTWLLTILIFGTLPAFGGMNMIVDDIKADTVVVDLRNDGVLRFHDNAGKLFFIRCNNYAFFKNMTFSSYRREFTTDGNGCQALIQNIKADLDGGKILQSIEVQIVSDQNRTEQMFVEPHYL